MDTTAYTKKSIPEFGGLYQRGMKDEVPVDHCATATNVIFPKKGEVQTRYGTAVAIDYTWQVKRFFLSSINANLLPITMDPSGNIYAGSTSAPVISNPAIIDFVGLNMFNKTYILPIVSGGGTNVMMSVYDGTTWRLAGGSGPTTNVFAVNSTQTGNVSPGTHQIAISFITSTGFTTPPGPLTAVTAPGGKKIDLSSIPIGPPGTVGRHILVTQANLLVLYYLTVINDNTTTSLTIDFFDTDLVVSADSLNDIRTSIPAGIAVGGLDKYHGCMITFGQANDTVWVSDSGNPESFNSVTGYVQIPSENDGNVVSGTFQINDLLYFTKAVGIFQSIDNSSGDPSTWPVVPIDGGTGAMMYGISSITGGQGHLTVAESVLIADIGGLYVFNGVVIRPPLTWKIEDLWTSLVNVNNLKQVSVFIDPFVKTIYAIFQNNSTMLVGDYNDGLDPTKIKWSQFSFTYAINCISMATMVDTDGEFGYCLRLGFVGLNGLFKYHKGILGDLAATATTPGTAFPYYIASGYFTYDEGSINIFRAIRVRMIGNSSSPVVITPAIGREDSGYTSLPSWSIVQNPSFEYFRQCNIMNEKAGVLLTGNDNQGGIILQRMDVFGNPIFAARPA